MRVAQVLPNFHARDAIGDNTLLWHDTLASLGHESRIFAQGIQDSVGVLASPIDYLEEYKPECIIYHYSTYSELARKVANYSGAKRVIIYHNVTPAKFFIGFSQIHYDYCERAREDLRRLSHKFDVALADSDFNADELREMGFRQVSTLRLVAPAAAKPSDHARKRLGRYLADEGTLNILYVGRICPNKAILDLVLAFDYIKSFVTTDARLLLVGSWDGFERYRSMLDDVIAERSLDDIYFFGSVSEEIRDVCYEMADVFVTSSEHEGFCVPILEAWRFGLPIVSSDSSALPETVGDAGILVPVGHPGAIAEGIREVWENESTRSELVQRGFDRYQQFSLQRFVLSVQQVLGG